MDAEYYGIPFLDPSMQATEIVDPVIPYGSVARTQRIDGLTHCYCADAKFSRLWANPDRLLMCAPKVFVEPNFSTKPDDDRAQVIWDIYRKRCLARYYQRRGIKIIVDLNVDPKFADLALLGVPEGWKAYATRSQKGISWDVYVKFYELARERAGGDIFHVMFGGGRKVEAACAASGWYWVPERSHVVRGLV